MRRKLNILMIMTDQECGIDKFPAGLLERLPGHRALLSRGVSLSNYHVHTTPCSPSRSTIYTGQHTQKTGVYENTNTTESTALPADMPTIGHMLRQEGYHTVYKGKWHLSSINGVRDWNQEVRRFYPNTRNALEEYGFSGYGFDGEDVGLTWAGFAGDRSVAGDAADSIRRLGVDDQQAPWFMAVNFVNPHDIMFFDATGEQWKTRAAPDLVAPMKGEPGDPLYAEDLAPGLPASFYKDDLSAKPESHRAINSQDNMMYGRMPKDNEAAWVRFRNYYFNCIRDVDQHLETLLWALESSGQLDNTVILLTSDHGERAGAHGMRQKGGTVYREETNVPMILIHPDGVRGVTSDKLMSSVDIAPTLLAFAGCEDAQRQTKYPDLKGVDVSALAGNPEQTTERDARGHLFNCGVIYTWERDRADLNKFNLSFRRIHRGVFDGRYKFARYFAPNDHHMPETWEDLVGRNDLELYDTAQDPDEIINLANNPEEWKEILMRLNSATNALVRREVGEDVGLEYPGPASLYVRAV